MSNYYNNNYLKDYKESNNSFPLQRGNTFNEQFILKTNNNDLRESSSSKNEIQKKIVSKKTISNLDNHFSKDFSKYIFCKRHSKNIISYFCETDKTFPCSVCISQHKDHIYNQFYCTEELFLEEINTIKNKYNKIEIKYFQNKKNAENFFLNIKNHFNEQINKINDYFDSMISILQDKKSSFITKMLIIYENFIKELIKFKSIFDICDKSYSNLYQKIIYIENELYKNGDYESFYNIKENIINDINNFSLYNDDNFSNNNKFNLNNNSMPYFLYPKKQIININEDDNLFGSFKNADFYLNDNNGNKEEENNQNINNNQGEFNKIRDLNLNNTNNILKVENNMLFDSIANNSTIKKEDNNNSLKKNLNNLESLFEKNKNKNIFSSINSNISNINDSFIEKQLIETNSTLFMLNKNDVKNVFKEQDLDTSINNYEKVEIKTKENNIKEKNESPKFNNNTSCNKEKRNQQIIQKFLENEELNKNNTFDIYSEQINLNINIEQKSYFNSNNITRNENKSINNTINDYIKFNNIYNMKKNISKGKVLTNINKGKTSNLERKRSGSMNKKYNKNQQINDSFNELNNKRINSKDKKSNSKKGNINNINRLFDNSYREDKYIFENNKIINIHNGFDENNINQYLLTKKNTYVNEKEIKTNHNSNKRKMNNIYSFENKKMT